jgi:hypothetical protein
VVGGWAGGVEDEGQPHTSFKPGRARISGAAAAAAAAEEEEEQAASEAALGALSCVGTNCVRRQSMVERRPA